MQGLRKKRRRYPAGLSLEQAGRPSDGLSVVPWSTRFADPIPVPKGKPLVTFKDAADYITKLPKDEQHHPAWQTAIEALILVAETNGPTMFARIGVMQALNRHHNRDSNPKQKEPHWSRRKLVRDQ